MLLTSSWHGLLAYLCILGVSSLVSGQTTITTAPSTTFSSNSTSKTTTTSSITETETPTPADVLLYVPTLSVGRIELDVLDLTAEINLQAQVANLVNINAGVAVAIKKVNLTITDVDAELELVVRLGHLVDIVNRVFKSLDLNPLLINTLNEVTGLVNQVVGEVEGLLGSITQGGTTLNFLIDNLGNIVQSVEGGASSIVGNYLQNMTYTGVSQDLGNGLTQKTYSYSPLGALVNIVFNAAGQLVQAVVQGTSGSGSSSSAETLSSTSSSSISSATASPITITSAAPVSTSDTAAASSLASATPISTLASSDSSTVVATAAVDAASSTTST